MRKEKIRTLLTIFLVLSMLAALSSPVYSTDSDSKYITFEANEGYVELGDFGWQNYTKLIEPDPYCEDCALFAPLDDLVDNGDGTGNTTVYIHGQPGTAKVYFNSTTGYPKLVSGVIGNAFEFDGNDGEGVSIDLGGTYYNTFTYVVWFSLTSYPSTDAYIISHYYSAESVYVLADGTLKFRVIANVSGTAATFDIIASTKIELNKNYFVVAGYSSSSGTMFLQVYDENGLIETQTKDIGGAYPLYYSTIGYSIGAKLNKAGVVSGIIDEARIYNRTPTPDEISLIYNLGRYRYALYRGDETSLPSYLNTTLFCPLDDLDTVNNVTTCYMNRAEQSATVYFNESTGYPKLVSGQIESAFEFYNPYPGTNTYVDRNIVEVDNILLPQNVSFAIATWFMLLGGSEEQPYNVVFSKNTDRLKLLIRYNDYAWVYLQDNEGNTHLLQLDYSFQQGKWYFVVVYYDFEHKLMGIKLYDDEGLVASKEEDANFIIHPYIEDAPLRIGARNTADYQGLIGKVDEFRFYIGKIPTDDEIQLLYYINRHKFATLSSPSATFNSTHFLVNITAQLPGDSGSYLLPAPLNAVSPYSSAGVIGNFTFLQVDSSSEASFQVPVTKDLTPPSGINVLAWLYNDEIYITGRSDQFPLIATVMNLPKGVWGLENGHVVKNVIYKDYTKLIIANMTAPDYVRRVPNLFVEPQGVDYVNVSVLRHSPEGVEINASAPGEGDVVFTIGGLWKDHRYNLYVDGDMIKTLKTNDSGWLSFTWNDWSSHVITLEPYSAGDEWFYDTIDLVGAIFAVFVAVPLLGLGYVIYLLNRTYTREGAVSEEIYNAVIQYGSLMFIIGLVGIVILVVLAYLSQML